MAKSTSTPKPPVDPVTLTPSTEKNESTSSEHGVASPSETVKETEQPKTPSVITGGPKEEDDKKEPIVTETTLKEPVILIPEATKPPVVRVQDDPTKSHKERIVAFLVGKHGTVRLNDFLKSLFPLHNPPDWMKQPVMKKLRVDLGELVQEQKVRFVGNNYEKLGRPHFPDQTTGKTHYWNLADTLIEVVIP